MLTCGWNAEGGLILLACALVLSVAGEQEEIRT